MLGLLMIRPIRADLEKKMTLPETFSARLILRQSINQFSLRVHIAFINIRFIAVVFVEDSTFREDLPWHLKEFVRSVPARSL